MNNFTEDNKYSLGSEITEKLTKFYYKQFDPYEIIRVTEKELQMNGIDVIVKTKSGYEINIDEKIRREEWGDILIEIYSDMNRKTLGWIFKKKTDYIVYYFTKSGRIFFLPFLQLKLFIKKFWKELPKKYKTIKAENKNYTTLSYAIPIKELINELSRLYLFYI